MKANGLEARVVDRSAVDSFGQEEEVEKLMAEALPKNFIDYEEYPQTADIQNRCVSMIARLFNAPTSNESENSMGTSTVGSSEAIVRPPTHDT